MRTTGKAVIEGCGVPRRRVLGAALACVTIALVGACERESGVARGPGVGEPLRVVVGVPPLVGIVRAIVPGAEVRSLVPPGQSVHGYELKPSDVRALAEAHVLVSVGLGVDPGLERFIRERARAGQRVIRFAQVAGIQESGEPDHHSHEGHDGHDHGEGGASIDPHLWLDPALVLVLAGEVERQAVATLGEDPANAERSRAVGAAHAGFVERVRRLDAEYADRLASLRGRTIVTHHDSFGRIADRYGLRVAAVIRSMESSEATPGAIASAVAAIKREGARAVFFEPAYDPSSARRIAEAAGVRLGRLDPESSEDWFGLMEGNLASLVQNLSDPSGVDVPGAPTSGAPPR
jgi:zinc transport system substrate-binding protein